MLHIRNKVKYRAGKMCGVALDCEQGEIINMLTNSHAQSVKTLMGGLLTYWI